MVTVSSAHPCPIPKEASFLQPYKSERRLTNQAQPNRVQQPHHAHNGQHHPPRRLRIQRQPEKPFIRGVLARRPGLRAPGPILRFENPMRIAGSGVDFVPPAETHKTSAGDVLQVVEIGGEEEDGDDEDEDTVVACQTAGLIPLGD